AFLADEMTRAGVDPVGIAMPDEAYRNENDRLLKTHYPKQAERAAIHQAWRELFDGLRDSGWFGSPGRAMSMDYGVVGPKGWDRAVGDTPGKTKLTRSMRKMADNLGHARERAEEVSLFDPKRPVNDRSFFQRMKNDAQHITYTRLGRLDAIIEA